MKKLVINDELKKSVVTKLLKMPIIASSCIKNESIRLYSRDGREYILASDSHGKTPDEDMCDLTLGFYKILYPEVKDEIGIDDNFMGDTMIDAYKDVLSYHSLANFWILPMGIGRSSKKHNKSNTRMDRFLNKINNANVDFEKYYRDYFLRFPRVRFTEKHFLNCYYDGNMNLKTIDSSEVAESIISIRAEEISNKLYINLFDYFNKAGLIYEDDFMNDH